LNVKDINYFWEFHTKRQTDPLSPRYKVVDENNNLIEYGKVDNKVMVRHPKEVNKVTSFDLKTDDISGAQAGTATQHLTKLATRDTFMKTQDIPGAQNGTLKKGMTTTRQLDPLWPSYVVPGHSEPEPIYTRNLVPSGANKTASNFGAKTEMALSGAEAWKNSQVSAKSQEVGNVAEPLNNGNIYPQTIGVTRKASGSSDAIDKTPLSQGNQARGGDYKKVTSSLVRTGEEILGGNKNPNLGGKTDYVPARMASKEDIDALEKFKQKKFKSKTEF